MCVASKNCGCNSKTKEKEKERYYELGKFLVGGDDWKASFLSAS